MQNCDLGFNAMESHFFFNPSDKRQENKFNLKSRISPPQTEQLRDFEDDLLKVVENVKFRAVRKRIPEQTPPRHEKD